MTQDKFFSLFLCTLNDIPDISDCYTQIVFVFCFPNSIILSKTFTQILFITYNQIYLIFYFKKIIP